MKHAIESGLTIEHNTVNWLDMETAPKDGTRILVYDGDCCCVVAWLKDLSGMDWCIPESWQDEQGGYSTVIPLGWMPTPQLPNK